MQTGLPRRQCAVGQVGDTRNPLDPLVLDDLLDLFADPVTRFLVRNLGDFDDFRVLFGDEPRPSSQSDRGSPGQVGLTNAISAADDSPGREVWSGDKFQQLFYVNILDALVSLIADAVVERLRPAGTDWIDQATSPLGRVRHNAAVKRRVAQGKPGASIVGREHRLSPEALQEEMQELSRKKMLRKVEPSGGVVDELKAELRTIQGGRR